MKMLAMSIRDAKTDQWSPPFFVRSRGEAMRSFMDEVNSTDPGSLIAKHPDDFALFLVGEFDVFEGSLVNGQQPVKLANGADLRKEGV